MKKVFLLISTSLFFLACEKSQEISVPENVQIATKSPVGTISKGKNVSDNGTLKKIAEDIVKNKDLVLFKKSDTLLNPVVNILRYSMNEEPTYEELSAVDVYPSEGRLDNELLGYITRTIPVSWTVARNSFSFWEVNANGSISVEKQGQTIYITNMQHHGSYFIWNFRPFPNPGYNWDEAGYSTYPSTFPSNAHVALFRVFGNVTLHGIPNKSVDNYASYSL